jgi:hypothetical protein
MVTPSHLQSGGGEGGGGKRAFLPLSLSHETCQHRRFTCVAGVIELSLSVSDCVRFNLPFPSLTASGIAANVIYRQTNSDYCRPTCHLQYSKYMLSELEFLNNLWGL